MRLPENADAKNKKNELEQLLKLKTEEIEQYKREQDIAIALERVREKALAMRGSSDISEATAVFFYELNRLGIEMERCGIVIFNTTPIMEVWSTPLTPKDNQIKKVITGKLDSRTHPMLQGVYGAWKKGKKYFSYTLKGDEVRNYYEKLKQVPEYQFPKTERYPDIQIDNCFYFNEGHLFVFTKTRLSKEVKEIFHRFTKVFSLAYTRYLDIKKAEEQTREAQIEAALERVRAKAMAMRSSKDISDATAIVFNELSKLGIEMDRCGIATYNETPEMEVWSTLLSAKDKQVIEVTNGKLDYRFNSLLVEVRKSWEEKKDYYSRTYTGDEVKKYYTQLLEAPDYHFPVAEEYPEKHVANMFYFEQGFIFIWTGYELSEEVKDILNRFTKVFSLTYTRYLDIRKAEAQARDAQVEASLERVRAKAMAMHSSKDIPAATAVVFNELIRLGIKLERCGITILNDPPFMEIWSTPLSPEDKQVVRVVTGKINYNIHPMLQKSYRAWKDKKDFFSHELKGAQVKKYYELLEKEPDYHFPKVTNYGKSQILNSFNFDDGAIFVYSKDKLPEETKQIIHRFSKVFSLTYRRYQDLIKAEAQTREAIKQASLNRVRGEIASMRSAEDLQRITPVIWRELKELEVPFIRCGVFIINEEIGETKAYLSTPEGKALAVLNLKIDENKLTRNTVDFWKKNQVYKEHWNEEDFKNWLKSMMKTGQVQSEKAYQGSVLAPESLHLHFIPFNQGMLYVGNTSPLSQEELDLVKSLAKSFSVAYARYEDFNNLEIAKEQIEKALFELKAAQAQLIHSAKMASLGELTAGIAHEIQNPLNFVNNFSEVSAELVDEVEEERAKSRDARDENLVSEILKDIKENLGKINHHGKRADAIVKGMLEHSRSDSGEKELTNLNTLTKEYLNLAFQGFKAKNKDLDIEMFTDYDSSLPKIEIVRSDIGKVLLNILNNAFYAVGTGHALSLQPMVTVTTKNLGNAIVISIQDNGPGIPDAIKDKIFQPFFTTKPTGKGTGLGLSLAYDIVKAHGGEILVESLPHRQAGMPTGQGVEIGKGTEFKITLPI